MKGQDAAEYAIALAGVALVVVLAVFYFGNELTESYWHIVCRLAGWACLSIE